MQATKEISFDDVGRRFLFTTTNHETVSGRTQNWLDVDGSVTGLGEPTLIGSGFDSAGHWWKVGKTIILAFVTFFYFSMSHCIDVFFHH